MRFPKREMLWKRYPRTQQDYFLSFSQNTWKHAVSLGLLKFPTMFLITFPMGFLQMQIRKPLILHSVNSLYKFYLYSVQIEMKDKEC